MNLVNKEYHKRARVLLENWQDRGVFSGDFTEPSDQELASIISLCLLKADVSISEANKLCKEAREYGLKSVCVNPALVEHAVQFASGEIPVNTMVGFPLGANHPQIKVAEAEMGVRQEVSGLEMVLNIGLLKTSNFQEVFEELRAVRYSCPEADLTVILETSLLEPMQIIIACMLCREAGVDDVKTSTSFMDTEVNVDDISLMRFVLGEDLGVVASGRVLSRETCMTCLKAGATRLSIDYLSPGKPLGDILSASDQTVST